MFSTERDQLRKKFFEAWRKHRDQLPTEPLEAQLINVMLLHPEYHELLSDPEKYQGSDFVESNPFLHMSLHIAIREQIGTNRPEGIREIYQNHCARLQDLHVVEHRMMECLGGVLWQAQQSGKMPDELEYLESLRGL